MGASQSRRFGPSFDDNWTSIDSNTSSPPIPPPISPLRPSESKVSTSSRIRPRLPIDGQSMGGCWTYPRAATAFRHSDIHSPLRNVDPIVRGPDGEFYVLFSSADSIFSAEYFCPNGITIDGNHFDNCWEYYSQQSTVRTPDFEEPGRAHADLMRKVCMAKFEQNPELRAELFRTGNATLVFGSARDFLWANGLDAEDPNAVSPGSWRGSNLMGQVLMAVRTALSAQFPDEFQSQQFFVERRQKRAKLSRQQTLDSPLPPDFGQQQIPA